MMKKVLIALDYNPTAQKVAETGYALAKSMKAAVFLLHVIADATYYSSTQYSPIMGLDSFGSAGLLQLDTKAEIEKAAKQFLERSKQHLEDERIQTLVLEGDFAESILEGAAELKADIIVMGTHSRRGLDKILMGSVAEKVLRHTAIPVLIIPTKEYKE